MNKENAFIKLPKTLEEKCEGKRIIVVLWKASLETVKTRKGDFELLNCDHSSLITKKSGKNISDLRPDIVHQELMSLLDSPLNKAGKLQIYVSTTKGVLIEVSSELRIPRTFKRFSGLMVQLLHKLKIKGTSTNVTLLKVIKNPISRHLPAGARIYGFSVVGTKYNPRLLAAKLPEDVPVVFYFGAMASGHITIEEHPEIEEMISVSEFSLSGALAINRVLGAVENEWGVV
mmetsp:Transcript_17118/g.25331  ORF Transcript_17118/g.25331 Transcript_17118/m.25331 type:complete len:231 (-) Transcript_17118:35-727(-)|eukprot:CAMPEP_0171467680 /NCGR_PEP_ID=MMETSP0945-20130129/10131_1 /TAXON_ID=109269 /ORGANISM="Vaucheria litorea, Strain CCMP2940" /LENGTH=230 /DNA_ID=CAMNT_0011996275 /DNA_START=18 /DNA_END=710 /DNA_ORIENTATION=+